MTKETMTVHKALAELKTMDSRIEKAIRESTWVVANKKCNTKIEGVSVKEWADSVASNFRRVNDLIRRREAIKRAVVNSNAVTKVLVAGVEFTVAEAIEYKNNGTKNWSLFAKTIANDLGRARMLADRANGDELERRADEHVKVMVGSSDMKGATAEVQRVREAFVEAQTVELVDPICAEEVIRGLENQVTTFLTEVDAALSVSNAITTIEVEY